MDTRSWMAVSLACLAGDVGAASLADATFRLEDDTVRLDHVLLVRHGNEEGLEDRPQLRIFLTDKGMPEAAAGAGSIARAMQAARAAGINGVVIAADPGGKSKGGIVSVIGTPGASPTMSISVTSTNAFKDLQASETQARGTIAVNLDGLTVEGRFDGPVVVSTVTADLRGEIAAASAPAQAVIGYLTALRKGDMTAAAKLSTEGRYKGLMAFKAQAGEAIFKKATSEGPSGTALAKSIKRVVIRGTTATVMTSDGGSMGVLQDGGTWKAD